jgi:hypothetical protein
LEGFERGYPPTTEPHGFEINNAAVGGTTTTDNPAENAVKADGASETN